MLEFQRREQERRERERIALEERKKRLREAKERREKIRFEERKKRQEHLEKVYHLSCNRPEPEPITEEGLKVIGCLV